MEKVYKQTNKQTNKHNYRKAKTIYPLYTSYWGYNNTIRVSNCLDLDLDQNQHSVGPYLGPNWLLMLSVDKKVAVSKERVEPVQEIFNNVVCETSKASDQPTHEYSMIKLLTEHHLEFLSLTEGCTGSSESTLIKMSNCWKSHATAQS